MATTAIWDVTDRLDRVIDYAANPEKTENPDFTSHDFQGLQNVLEYTHQDVKTEKQFYVTPASTATRPPPASRWAALSGNIKSRTASRTYLLGLKKNCRNS